MFVQAAAEMWSPGPSGERMVEMAVNGAMREILDALNANMTAHSVTLIVFARLLFDDERPAKDIYRIVADNECYEGRWTELLAPLKAALVEIAAAAGLASHAADGSPAVPSGGRLAPAYEGNILEAINLSLNIFDLHYLNRDLTRTGQSIIVVTPGSGAFKVDPHAHAIAKKRVLALGIGVDILCLGRPPLHTVPLFVAPGQPVVPHWVLISFWSPTDGLGAAATAAASAQALAAASPAALLGGIDSIPTNAPLSAPLLGALPPSDVSLTESWMKAYDEGAFSLTPAKLDSVAASQYSSPHVEPLGKVQEPSSTVDDEEATPPPPSAITPQDTASPRGVQSVSPPRRTLLHASVSAGTFPSSWNPSQSSAAPLAPVIKIETHPAGPAAESTTPAPHSSWDINDLASLPGDPLRILSGGYGKEPLLALAKIPGLESFAENALAEFDAPKKPGKVEDRTNPFGGTAGRKSRTTAGRRRWGHVSVRAYDSELNWASIIEPACLPLTSDYLPSASRLANQYQLYSYPIKIGNTKYNEDVNALICELVAQRLVHNYQMVSVPGGSSDPTALFATNTLPSRSIWLSKGTRFHNIVWDPETSEIIVKRYHKREESAIQNMEYSYELWARHDNAYETVSVQFRVGASAYFPWYYVDSLVAGQQSAIVDDIKPWGVMFAVFGTWEAFEAWRAALANSNRRVAFAAPMEVQKDDDPQGAVETKSIRLDPVNSGSDWLEMVYETTFCPDRAYHVNLRWVLCSGRTIGSIVRFMSRQARTCGLEMIQSPMLHQNRLQGDHPLRRPIMVPWPTSVSTAAEAGEYLVKFDRDFVIDGPGVYVHRSVACLVAIDPDGGYRWVHNNIPSVFPTRESSLKMLEAFKDFVENDSDSNDDGNGNGNDGNDADDDDAVDEGNAAAVAATEP